MNIHFILNSFESFFKAYPALLYGIVLTLGIAFGLTENPALVLPSILLLLTKHKRLLVYCLLITTLFFAAFTISKPDLGVDGLKGTAHFEISSIAIKSSHFGKHFVYKGLIKSMPPFQGIKNIHVALSVPVRGDIIRPPADKSYMIEGTLKEFEPYAYHFTLEKNSRWRPIKNSFSLAEYRYMAKKYLTKLIHKKIPDKESASFLSGIATGEFDDRMMSFHFARFGLQHIMAISGFHFAIISGILSFILQLFLSKKNTAFVLIGLLLSYFIFLGFAPSILRAFMMIVIALAGSILKKQASAMNSLGIALIAVLVIDPLVIMNLGFQFSFVTTASILIFYSKTDSILQKIFAKRLLAQAVEMNALNQHGLIAITIIRQAFALTFAVNLGALPLMLFHFQQFPYLSIIYNFFFPFMVSISMLLLILGFALPFIPWIDTLNAHFTKFVLNFAYNMPQTVDYKFYYNGLTFEMLVIYYSILFFTGIILHYMEQQKEQERLDFAYI